METNVSAQAVFVQEQELRKHCNEALLRVGVPAEHAEMATDVLVTADLQGISTHGTSRLPAYVKRIRSGLINPQPHLEVRATSESIRLLDGDNGLGTVVGSQALQVGIDVARSTGICFVGCKRSNHFGAGAPYALAACRQGMLVCGATNAFPSIAPTGSTQVMVGNNPLFVGAPRRAGPHFILDIAMSVAARGKLRAAAQRGESIPAGWAIGPNGQPTRDPLEGLQGLVLPIGGHKGYGLALAVDVLAGVLTNGGVATEVLSMYQQWERPQNVGHMFIVLNPTFFMPIDVFFQRMDALMDLIKTASSIDVSHPVRYPGEIEAAAWDQRRRDGIPFDEATWNALVALAHGNEPERLPGF